MLKNPGLDDRKLSYLFDRMTHDEKIDILSLDYARLWFRLWLTNPDQTKSNERYDKYLFYKKHFVDNFLKDGGKKLRDLISKSKCTQCLWEIPKGRKSFPQEKDINTAMREFEEETGISSLSYNILDETPLIMSNISNGVKYMNYYYLTISDIEITTLNYNNTNQLAEVSDIGWFDLEKINLLESQQLNHLIKNVNKILRKRYKITKLAQLNLLNIKNTSN